MPPMTVQPLAEAIVTLLKDKERRLQMGQKGLITAQKYSWEDVSTRVLKYYDKIIDQQRRKRAVR